MPRANTGSRFLNCVSDTTMFLLQMERRIDPWLRPILGATLRDPVARVVTTLMNEKRKDDGLKIAKEKLLPNEEEYLNSVIESFSTQMRGLWKPGGFERGGNTKTPGQCCADSVWLRQGAEFRVTRRRKIILLR